MIEVGAHSRWVSSLLRGLGHQVTAANPRRVKLISESDNKTDRHDAELLARLGRTDVKLLAPVEHRTPQAQADLALAKARDTLVATRTKLVNHVRGTVKSFGERLPMCTTESFARQTRVLVPAELKPALEPIYQVLDRLDEQIKEHDKLIQRVAKRHVDVDVVSQISGVGVLTALVFLLTIEDKNRFAKSRMVGAFVGLRPRKSKSGDGDPQLRITKAGDPFLRRLLVNGANYILGPFGKDSDLRRWGLELAKRGGKNAKKRATVAVARKLAVLMHRLWGDRRSVRATRASEPADGRSGSGLNGSPKNALALRAPQGSARERTTSGAWLRSDARRSSLCDAPRFRSTRGETVERTAPDGSGGREAQERPQEVERPETAPSGRLRFGARAFELGREMSAPVRVGPQPAPGRFGGPSTSANGSAAVRCFVLLWTRPTKKSLPRAASSWKRRRRVSPCCRRGRAAAPCRRSRAGAG